MTNFLFFFFSALIFALGFFLLARMGRKRAVVSVAFALCVAVFGSAFATTIGGFLYPAPYNIVSTASECDGIKGRGNIYVALKSTGGSAVDTLALCGAGASGATPAYRVATLSTAATVFP